MPTPKIHMEDENKPHFLTFTTIVQSYKSFTTKEIKKLIANDTRKYIRGLISTSFYKKDKNEFQIWQEYNYPEVITTEKFFQEKLNYIHNNPAKKEYVNNPEDWKYSSAGFYLNGDISIMSIDKVC